MEKLSHSQLYLLKKSIKINKLQATLLKWYCSILHAFCGKHMPRLNYGNISNIY